MKHVRVGEQPSASEQNKLVDAVNSMIGSGYIQGFSDSTGFHTRRTPAIVPDISKLAGSVRLAYCKDDAGNATVIDCYLDADASATVISVECDIAGGGLLNSAEPRLTDGLVMPVVDIDGTWYSLFPFQATEDCECTASPLDIADGGTGAITAAAAAENLGVGITDSPTFAGLAVTGKATVGSLIVGSVELTAAGPTDNLDVAGIGAIFIDTSSNNVTLGGTINGVDGQILHIAIHDWTNDTTLEHNEGTGNQDFMLHAEADEVMTGEPGGWTLINHDGDHWHDISHAKHV